MFASPPDCPHNLLPVLHAHIGDVYGVEVATVLCQPAQLPYFSIPSICPNFSWSTLTLNDSVCCLRHLTIDTLSQAIKCLLVQGHPTVHSHSRTKISNGLAIHI